MILLCKLNKRKYMKKKLIKMKKRNLFFILLVLVTFLGCNKVRTYKINIVNNTEFDILELKLSGTTEYNYSIVKGGETGVHEIEWKGSRSHLDGEYGFSYRVNSFSDSIMVYNDSSKCGFSIIVNDLSEVEVNTLTLYLSDSDLSACGNYVFKIDYQEY